ncbi:chitinase class I [Mucilaginibacter gracilis]|uniref:Chitinase class I n=1 Tax=Mucilaginibacter gracilis TaxID=423350 RepID=A0A495J409_9SPHI|nr:chitinase [Mucilaginibacter gracilis]RKR83421.1 chitinase class I [Mucilaginibacter gracilis]
MYLKNTIKLIAIILLFTLPGFKCGIDSGSAARPTVSSIFSEKDFNDIFPMRDKFYSYAAFIKACNQMSAIKVKVEKRSVSIYKITRTDSQTGITKVVRQDDEWEETWAKAKPYSTVDISYVDFCTEKDAATNKKELAAFLAHIAHETRHGENGKYNDGLMYTHELNTALPYYAENDTYPPVKGKNYYGRGPLQLSYNGNYGYASDCIFGDKTILLNNPDLVTTDAVVAFKTAIYFWMTPQTFKPSAHNVMVGNWKPNADDIAKGRVPGFGMTINIVNGAVECNKGEDVFSMTDRIGYYRYFLKKLAVTDDNCQCSCGKMQPYE